MSVVLDICSHSTRRRDLAPATSHSRLKTAALSISCCCTVPTPAPLHWKLSELCVQFYRWWSGLEISGSLMSLALPWTQINLGQFCGWLLTLVTTTKYQNIHKLGVIWGLLCSQYHQILQRFFKASSIKKSN